MNVTDTPLSEVKLIEPRVFHDDRGHFFESFNDLKLSEGLQIRETFVQDNESRSKHGVLRGLHYQIQHAQGKLVRAVSGEIFDVAVDLRRTSPNFGRWTGARLSGENRRMLWVPPGFAHGFLVTAGPATVLYKTTDYYFPEHERSIRWDDPDLAIEWPAIASPPAGHSPADCELPLVSEKDRQARFFAEAEVYAG